MARSYRPADLRLDEADPASEPDDAPDQSGGGGSVPPVDPLAPWRPPPPIGWVERFAALGGRLPVAPGRAVAVAVAAVAVAVAAWWLLRPPPPPVEAALPLAGAPGAPAEAGAATGPAGGTTAEGATGSVSSTTAAAELVVQAAGAVGRPGVYRLPAGSRVDDLVRAAGGAAPDADVDRVNLAAPVADGERVWVPRRGELAPPDVVAGAGGGTAPPGSGPAGGGPSGGGSPGETGAPSVVNLNTATAEELDTLPGVGPATATAILAYRDEHGPFGSVDELLEVRGIGDAKLEQLRPLVTV